MIKCEGIKLQTAAFIGTHYPSYLQLSSRLQMIRRNGDAELSGGQGGVSRAVIYSVGFVILRCFAAIDEGYCGYLESGSAN